MTSRRLARVALRCYPPATRTAHGAEMLDTLMEAAGDRDGVFVRDVASLVIAGLSERARANARASVGGTLADSAKLAAILCACVWLTAQLTGLINRSGWHQYGSRSTLDAVALLLVLLAWSLGSQRLAGMIGVASVVSLVVVHPSGGPFSAAVAQPIVPAFGYVIMCVAPARKRPSAPGVAALAALAAVSVIVSAPNGGGGSAFIVLVATSIAGLLVFAVQPRLAIAAAIVWTGVGVDQILVGGAGSPPFKLLVVAAPAALAATAARAQMIRRGAA